MHAGRPAALEQCDVVGVEEVGHGDQQAGARGADDVGRLRPLEPGVDGCDHAAGSVGAQRGHDPARAVGCPDRHPVTGLEPLSDVRPRRLVGRARPARAKLEAADVAAAGSGAIGVDQRLPGPEALGRPLDQRRDGGGLVHGRNPDKSGPLGKDRPVPTTDGADTEPPDDLEPAIGAIYGGPLDEFVAARDGLARELRAAGRRDDAAAVRKLAKPRRARLGAGCGGARRAGDGSRPLTRLPRRWRTRTAAATCARPTNALRAAARSLADAASERAAASGARRWTSPSSSPRCSRSPLIPKRWRPFGPGGWWTCRPPVRSVRSRRARRRRARRLRGRTRDSGTAAPAAAESPPASGRPAAGRSGATAREVKAAERAAAQADAAVRDGPRPCRGGRRRSPSAAAAELAAAEDRRRSAQREVEAARERLDGARRDARRAAAEAQEAEDAAHEARSAQAEWG